MIHWELLRDSGVLVVTPEGPLSKDDFTALAKSVDPYIEENGELNGLMICAKSFPGWADFAGLISHLRFVRDHHQHIKKVAAVTDSGFLQIVQKVAKHFVHAQIRHFEFTQKDQAMEWLTATE